jgi:hypothetical protein
MSNPTGAPQNAPQTFASFAEFYPFYLGEHKNPVCRTLHFVGSNLVLGILLLMVLSKVWWLAAVALLTGYGFAWIGHFFFEKNRPATFKHPLYSFVGDWVMWWQLLTGKIRFG